MLERLAASLLFHPLLSALFARLYYSAAPVLSQGVYIESTDRVQ